VTHQELIAKAASVVRRKTVREFTIADVGCALITSSGHVYTGVCIDTGSGMGICAEHNAIGSMITEGEFRIKTIVAVWKDDGGNCYVVAPCGKCREFMYQIGEENLKTEVILGNDKVVTLKDLLPYFDWYRKA